MPDTSLPQTTYAVTGMTCGHCAAAVRTEVEGVEGVTTAIVDHEAGTLVVTGTASAERVGVAVREAGYALVD